MKAFVFGLAAAVLLAVGTGFVLEGFFSHEADATFATPSVRVGGEASIEHRGWNFDGKGGEG